MNEKTYDGATTALHRRIEELTAELAQWKQALGGDFGPQTPAEVCVFLREAERVQGHVAALEISKLREALATERAAREQMQITVNVETMAKLAAERERDTALADIERMKRTHGDRDEWVLAAQRADTARIAAETALASARELLDHAETVIECAEPHVQGVSVAGDIDDWKQCYGTWLTSHPAPVAAPLDCHTYPRELYGEGFRVAPGANLETPVAAPCAGCEAAHAELERRTAWSNNQIALLLRRLRFRNETIAFLTKSKIEFSELDTPASAEDLLFYHWWVDVREWGRELEKRLRAEEKTNKGLRRHIRYLQLTCMMLGNRLHVKRAEAAHWQSLYRGSEMKSSPSSSPRLPGRTRGSGGC